MATNNNINYGPAALPGTVPTPVLGNNIDRAPAPVAPGAGTGYVPTVTQPVRPVTEQPVINPPIVVARTAVVIPVAEQPVATVVAESTTGPDIAASNQQRYLTILANGSVVTDNAATLDFEGNGFTITSSGPYGAVITLSGAAGYGNSNVSTFLAAFGSNTLSTTGNITGNYFIGNGSQLTGIVANTGNVTFNNQAVVGTGDQQGASGLYLAPGIQSVGNLQYLRVRGGDLPTHIHLDTGNNTYFDQYFGDDNKYVKLANTGNIVINTNNLVDASAQWTFGTDGKLNLPGANADYTIATQSGYITVGNLLIGQGGSLFNSNNDSWALYGNISDPGTSISIPSDAAAGNGTPLVLENQISNVEIRSGFGTWTFDTDGVLTAPGNIVLLNGAVIKDTVGGAVAFGVNAGLNSQGIEAVAIGLGAGSDTQGNNAVAIGEQAGNNAQGIEAVAIGRGAGATTQGNRAVAISIGAGGTGQGEDAIAIGYNAGTTGQTEAAVAIGRLAGQTSQSGGAVAIGVQAGADTQSVSAVAIGSQAGENSQGQYAVAIGDLAGATSQGIAAVAIGALAGRTSQGNNSIIINATDANLDQTTANTFTVAPIRNDVANTAEVMFYNTTSKEITYGNVISVTGNITGNYILGNGSQLTSINAVTVDITDTNGLTTVYYPTFVENRTTAQIARADVDLTYRTDDNLLTVGNVSVTGNITGGNVITGGLISATGNVSGNYFIGNGAALSGIAASVPGQTILPTVQTITAAARPAGLFGGGQGGANVTVANVIPVTEYGVIITDGTSNEKYATGSLGSIPGTVSLNFDTGLNSTQYTLFAYVTSNAGTYYSNAVTGTSGICLLAGTQIALSDGTHKAIEHITYTDKLLSWDFDRGCYAETTAMWIKRGETGSQYNLLTFSDGTTLRTFDQHRIFNKQAGAFTYPMTSATPVGTATVNEHGQEIILTNKQVIQDAIEYYNVITDYHMNLFSDSVLTSCRFNNIYPITDMKFVKDGRTLRTRAEFQNVPDRFFYGLRLAEQTTDVNTVEWYVNRLLSTEVSTESELAV